MELLEILNYYVSNLGPCISPEAKKRIEGLIASAAAEGGTILLDGRGHTVCV